VTGAHIYRKGGGLTWYFRVTFAGGERRVLSTETRDEKTARALVAWVVRLKDRHDPAGILDAVQAKTFTIAEAYRLGETRALAEIVRRREAAADIDVRPLLDAWREKKRQSRKGAASVDKYHTQITTLYPENPLRRSLLAARELYARLDKLEVSDPTRNRYRAAVSSFCDELVRAGHLDVNPARAVRGYAENRPGIVHYTDAEARRLIEALPMPSQALEAVMCATGADCSDLLGSDEARGLAVGDVRFLEERAPDGTLREVVELDLRGHKTPWRTRTVRMLVDWCVPYLRRAIAGKLPAAPVFDGLSRHYALRVHKRTAAALRPALPDHSLHDWRHTFAVRELRLGRSVSVVAAQLGHANPYQVWTRYGLHVPSARDYRTADERAAVAPVSAPDAEKSSQTTRGAAC